VILTGLNGRSDLNQKGGTVLAYLKEKNRFSVRVEKTGEVVALKPENLEVVEGSTKEEKEDEERRKSWAKEQLTKQKEEAKAKRAEATSQSQRPAPKKEAPPAARPTYKAEEKAPEKAPLRPSSSTNVNSAASNNPSAKKEGVQPPLKPGEAAIYTMTGEKVTVVKVHSEDDPTDPYYTIKMADGREKQSVRNKMELEATLTAGGKAFKEHITVWIREGDILSKATVGNDKTLSYESSPDHIQVCLDYLKSLDKNDRRGCVTLPKARSGLKKLKKDVDLFKITGLSAMIDKALVELSLNF